MSLMQRRFRKSQGFGRDKRSAFRKEKTGQLGFLLQWTAKTRAGLTNDPQAALRLGAELGAVAWKVIAG
jgi:hypothetical protein